MPSWQMATFTSLPTIDAKICDYMAAIITFEQVKNFKLKQEHASVNPKLLPSNWNLTCWGS